MFRVDRCATAPQGCFPRIRGDVPPSLRHGALRRPFSPHTRGCSYIAGFKDDIAKVFPAYAGMFPANHLQSRPCGGFPRIRGDVPLHLGRHLRPLEFSPHTRGCSAQPFDVVRRVSVFPAYAGMFLIPHDGYTQAEGFPRIRGDVPLQVCYTILSIAFSPHTRGCSSAASPALICAAVFPAYAGMFLVE